MRNTTSARELGLATYGGAMFLFPPRRILGVWTDRRLDFATTLEERLLGARLLCTVQNCATLRCCADWLFQARPSWRRIAKLISRKKLVHVPLGRFSQATIQQLRLVSRPEWTAGPQLRG